MEINVIETRERLLREVKEEIERLNIKPTLAIVKCSDDKASDVYIRNKIKTMDEVGIAVRYFELNPRYITQEELEYLVDLMNLTYNATIVQLPLDKKFDESAVLENINPLHDCDGLTLKQIAWLRTKNKNAIFPATAGACFEIIKDNIERLEGLDVCIVNRSKLIGLPLQSILTNHDMTVTLCHSKTKWLKLKTNDSQIAVLGTGQPEMFDETYLKPYQLVLDCGISFVDGKLKRDVDPYVVNETKVKVASKVGIVTTDYIAKNVLACYKLQNK